MSPSERRFWQRVNQRAASKSPEMNRAILKAFQQIRDSISDKDWLRLVNGGGSESLIQEVLDKSTLDRAFIPTREELRRMTKESFEYFTKDLPKQGKIDGQLAVMFDTLNPRVLDAVRQLESRVITSLQESVRETVRQAVLKGLESGTTPRQVASGLRDVIGLSANQEEAVRNFQKSLRGEGNPLDYKMRDRRFDKTIAKGELTETQIEKMTDAYRRRRIALNANTVAQTATRDSLKLGQHLSIQDAIDKGVMDANLTTKTWRGVMDDREREEHKQMEGETVAWDQPYSNGQMVPGDGDFNCRCLSVYRMRAA